MKKFLSIIITLIAAISCTNLDEVWEELRDHEERIQKLEALCNKLNSNVEAIQTILTALGQNDYITDIVKIMEDGVEVGYSITFAKGGTVTIYHGTDGTDGSAPKVSIRKAQDGEYYWTADDEWMTDENGEKIPAVVADDPDGEYITPQFRVADGLWYVSYDNGNSWREIDGVSNEEEEGDQFFSEVTYDEDFVYLTLADGTQFKIPTWKAFEELQDKVDQANSNIAALQAIVAALQNNDYVTSVVSVYENGQVIGYTITFSKSGTVTIYHGKDGADGADGKPGADGSDGADGKDGQTPVIGIKKDVDGVYYWTLNGEWLLDDNGEKVPASGKDGQDGAPGAPGQDGTDGVTPEFKIENGYWYVSYGEGWIQLGQATGPQGPQGPQGDNIFFDFFYDSTTVTFVLWDGTEISVPLNSVDLSFSNYEICINGDSISTESAGRWPVLLKNSIQFRGYKNIAVGGTRVKGEINSDERINRIPNTTNIILTLGGTNDWAQDIPLGDLSTIADPETFYGAVDLYIKKVLAKNPNIIVVMGSNPYGCCPGRFTSSDMDIEGGAYNNINEPLHTYAKAIREVAEYNSVYYIPIYEECGINQYNYEENLLRQYNSFGNLVYLHPNDVGAAKMLKVIVRHLRNVIQWSQD